MKPTPKEEMVATKVAVKYPCGVCGKMLRAEQSVFSSHTRARYCADDMMACRKRAKRKGGTR